MKPIIVYTDQIDDICERVLELYHEKQRTQPGKRLLISLAGFPGSGKTTLASNIPKEVTKSVKCQVLPQDGFHLYRKQLGELTNAQEAIIRRGAPFTFNVDAFVALLSRLNDPSVDVIKAPSFDHELKDPIEDDIIIDAETRIVIVEGNYVSLKDKVWNEISNFVDETWFCETPLDIVRDRLIHRHLLSKVSENVKEAEERADGSDLMNALYILENSKEVDLRIITR